MGFGELRVRGFWGFRGFEWGVEAPAFRARGLRVVRFRGC